MESNKILIVDDEKLIVEYVSMGLEMEGYNVVSFTNPKNAVEYLKNNIVDLVLTDLKMPEISGLDIVQVAKEYQVDAEVIIFTGYASLDSAIEAVRENVYDYVQKPLEMKDLILSIKRALDSQAIRRENKRLNQRIHTMFEQISMLYEISRIIYQIDDQELIFKFVIDTITEGMGFKNTGVFLLDEDHYFLVSQSILPQNLITDFTFTDNDEIGSIPISDVDPTKITNLKGEIPINQKILTIEDQYSDLHLFPIKFLDRLIGFLAVLSTEDESLSDQDDKLLQILTTQIAPIFYRFIGSKSSRIKDYSTKFALEVRLEEELFKAINNDKIISLSVIELANFAHTILPDKLNTIHGELEAKIRSKFGNDIYALWVAPFLLFLLIPDKDKISSELDIIELGREFVSDQTENTKIKNLDLFSSTVDCQQDGITTQSLLNHLWKKFLPLREKRMVDSLANDK